MKNIFTLLLGGLITTSAFASNITLRFSGNRNYQVMIDGRNVDVNSYYHSNTISLNNLQTGQHSIEVYKLKQSHWFGAGNKLVYSSYFNVTPQTDLNINIDDSGYAKMYESRSADYGRNNGDWRNHEGNFGKDRDEDDRNYGRNDNDEWKDHSYNRAMNDYDFSRLVQRIRSQWFGKFSAAKNAVSNNYLATYQVKQILQIFSSEDDKVDLAKLAYKNIVDQENFRQLYDMVSYRGQSELESYINNKR